MSQPDEENWIDCYNWNKIYISKRKTQFSHIRSKWTLKTIYINTAQTIILFHLSSKKVQIKQIKKDFFDLCWYVCFFLET